MGPIFGAKNGTHLGSLFGSFPYFSQAPSVHPLKAEQKGKVAPSVIRAAPTAEESKVWQQQLADAVRKRKADSSGSVDAVMKKLKASANVTRLATYHHGLRLDNALRNGVHTDGFECWIPTDPGRPAWDDLAEGEKEAPLLTSLCDEEGKQWALYRYLVGARAAQWHQENGPIHRRHNDWHRALSQAGVLDTWVTMLFELNIGRGPLGSKQWHLDIEAFAFDAAINMNPDHEHLLFCWTGICSDRGWTEEAETNREARVLFLQTLVAERCVRIVGSKAAYSKWWSIFNGAKESNTSCWTKLFVLIGLCVKKGWVVHIDSVFRSNHRDALPPEARGAYDPVLPDGDAAVGGAVGSGDPMPKAKAKAKAKAVGSVASEKQKGKAVISSLLSRSQNSVHALCRLMADSNRRCVVRSILGLGEPLAREHKSNCQVKNVEDTVKWHIAVAKGSWFDTCKDVWRQLSNARVLAEAGFQLSTVGVEVPSPLSSPEAIAYQDMVAGRIWKIARCLSQERISSMCRTKSYPSAFAPICSDDPASVALYMDKFKTTWESFVWAVRHDANVEMCDIARKHSLASRHCQDTARIIRADSYTASSRVVRRLLRYFNGWPHEHMFENCMREFRHQEIKVTSNQVLKSVKAYMTPVKKKLMADFDRPEIKTESVVPVVTETVKQDSMYRNQQETPSRAQLRGVTGETTWPTFDAQSVKAQNVLEALCRDLHSKDQPALALEVWRSEVLPVGQLVLHKATAVEPAWIMLVVYKCKYGVIGLPMQRTGVSCIFVDLDAPDIIYKHIYSFHNIMVLRSRAISPSRCDLLEAAVRNKGVLLSIGTEFIPVVTWQAEAGFLGCGEAVLKKLFEDIHIDIPPITEHGLDYDATLCLALIRHIRPECTPEEAAEALCRRVVDGTRIADDDIIIDIPQELIEDVAGNGDRKHFLDYKKEVKEGKDKRARIHTSVRKAVISSFDKVKPKKLSDVEKKAMKDKLSTKAGADRWWSSIRGDAAWLREWAPPNSGIFVDDPNGRFRVWYKDEGPRSVSWYKRGMETASTEALRLLWGWHHKCTGEVCPIPL
jgi:hypothetical protein